MNKTCSKIKPEIAKEYSGFVQGTGTRNAILIIRMLSEQATGVQKDLDFRDCAKTFDNVQHGRLFVMLE